jgi:penicillin-binding protein 2
MTGLIPTSAWKEKRFKEPWMAGETISASIGQGFNLVTPIQLAVAYGAIANGGALVKPRLVLRVGRTATGVLVDVPQTESGDRVPVRREYPRSRARPRSKASWKSRTDRPRARVCRACAVAGKTGTAQVVGLKHTEGSTRQTWPASCAITPGSSASRPRGARDRRGRAVEHGGHGGSAAAPVVQKVLARYFEKRAVQERARAGGRGAFGGLRRALAVRGLTAARSRTSTGRCSR